MCRIAGIALRKLVKKPNEQWLPKNRKMSFTALALLAVFASSLLNSGNAVAQTQTASTNVTVDINGIDVIDGLPNHAKEDISIGPVEGVGGLKYVRMYGKAGWTDNLRSRIEKRIENGQNVFYVTIGNNSEKFTRSGSIYTPQVPMGSGLTSAVSGAITSYTYTLRDGTIIGFVENSSGSSLGIRIDYVQYPTKDKDVYNYKSQVLNSVRYERLQSVTNNTSWQIKIGYGSNSLSDSTLSEWQRISSVKGINNVVSYCDPAADACSTPEAWAEAIYTQLGTTTTTTDATSAATTYTHDATGRLIGIRRPGSSADNVAIGYDASGKVSSLNNDGDIYNYSYSDVGNERTTTVSIGSTSTVYKLDLTARRITSVTDQTGKLTSFQYDASGRLFRVTKPEGNYEQYDRDSRGNVTTLRKVAKPGSGLADIVETYSFDASCANTLKCNKPNSYMDSNGKQTTYTYNVNTGGISAIRYPVLSNGDQVKKFTIYNLKVAKVKNASGTLVDQAIAVYRATSDCTTYLGNCLDSGEKTTFDYAAASNLLRGSIIDSAANGTVPLPSTYGFDRIGNVVSRDGPLSGAVDSIRIIYDSARRPVGQILPDPDGAGSRALAAIRTSYNGNGLATSVEYGTVNSQSDADWSAFAVSSQVLYEYDTKGRRTKTSTISGGVTYEVEQASYDTLDRLSCVATRMNPSVFGSLPSSACQLTAAGAFGPDRIKKFSYDNAGRLLSTVSGFGTADEGVVSSFIYTPNGLISSVDDGENNRTTYFYNGFDRKIEARMPVLSQGASASSASDKELYTYDAAGNLISRTQRDGTVIQFGYDAMGRQTLRDLPVGQLDISYQYDLKNRITSATQGTGTLTWVYDENGNVKSASGPLGAISYEYDPGGRLSKMTWPDGFYVTYDYDNAGKVTAIRENGALSGPGVLATYSYDNLGRRTSIVRGNGTVSTYSYDSASRINSLTHDLAGTAADVTYNGYFFNPAQQIVGKTSSNDSYAWLGHYNINRNYSANGLNQLTSAGTTSFSYDARGNLTASGSALYTYNADNQLMSGPGAAQFQYDPAGRLAQAGATAMPTTKFQYDGSDLIAEYDGAGILQRRYIFGAQKGELLTWYEGSGTSSRRWFHQDDRGSVVALTDGSGGMIAINKYDEYGIPHSSNIGRFQFGGQIWLQEVGFYYSGARMYSATLGRFLQTDPIGYADGPNVYQFAGSDPINMTDKTGLKKEAVDEIVVSGFLSSLDSLLEDFLVDVFSDTSSSYWLLRQSLRAQGDPEKKKQNAKRKSKKNTEEYTTCSGFAEFTAVGGDQAQADGALYSKYPEQAGGSIKGGAFGTVAVKEGFLGLDRRQWRTYGTRVFIYPDIQARISKYGGPIGALTVSDYGDKYVQNTSGVAFDLYRFPTEEKANEFGRQKNVPTGIAFPKSSGAQCPPGFKQVK